MAGAAEDHRNPFAPAWRDPSTLVATAGGIGLLPKAPGTWGSLAALPLAWVLLAALGPIGLVAAALAVALLGWAASARVVARTRVDDPGPIVIDEVAGQMLTLAAATTELWQFAVGFALFRLFDIFKPWPASWADRAVKGGLGVMADDLIAALYALAALWLIVRIAEGALR